MRVAGVWVHPVLTGRVLMMAGRFCVEVLWHEQAEGTRGCTGGGWR